MAEANLSSEFLNPFVIGTKKTLETQASVQLKPGKAFIKKGAEPNLEYHIAGIISITSKGFSGSIALCFPKDVFLKIYEKMLGETHDEIDDEVYGAIDPYTTAKIIKAALKNVDYDLIIAGQRAVDGDNYQVPAFLAEMLSIPMITGVVSQEISGDTISCKQLIEGGTATLKTRLPAIITKLSSR